MKKTKILVLCVIFAVLACVLLAGCSNTEEVTSIELKDNSTIEVHVGKFNYGEQTLLATYNSGSVVEVPLKEEMISKLDQLKLYQPGEHVINVSYGGQTCEIKVIVRRDVFSELRFPENNVFTYDGQAHTVEIEGELPANASVSYLGGNSFVNAGTYDVTAVVSCDGYETARVTTTVTVECAKYDMGNVKFEPKEVVYNGKPHFVKISGELPKGVSEPTYYINENKSSGVIDVGEYTVKAVFTVKDPNYEPIPNMETTLKITPAEYNIDELDLVFKTEKGTELFGAFKTYDGTSVTFDIADKSAISNKISVSYTVSNEAGEIISKSNTSTNIKDAGEYTIKVELALLDNKNYKAIEPMEFTFDVFKAEYDTSGLLFESRISDYNGEKNSIYATLPKNWDASEIDVVYEYILNGSVVKENGENATGVYDAGEYTVNAKFIVKNSNYAQIEPVQATLVIKPKMFSVSDFEFKNTNLTYTGQGLLPSFNFDTGEYFKVDAISLYKLVGNDYVKADEAIEVGSYRIEADISVVDEKNYIFDDGRTNIKIIGIFEIKRAEIDISGLGFVSGTPIVDKGAATAFEFSTDKIGGIVFETELYKNEGENLSLVVEAMTVTADETGVISVTFDTSELEHGEYIAVITARTDSENYILSNGNETAEYYFDFEIVS